MISAESAPLFLLTVAFVSLSGVIMPGPVLAATITKGYEDQKAGLKIALGHSFAELPLIVLIFFGFDFFFKDPLIFSAVGLLGGALLLYMGYEMVRDREKILEDRPVVEYTSFTAGIVTTAANPYFFLWWATVGAALIAGAVEFGWIMLPIFAAVHLSCDFLWGHFVAYSIFKTKGLWSKRRHHFLFLVAGLIMLIFGLYFIVSSTLSLF